MALYIGNDKISFKIGTLTNVSEERIISQISAAVAQAIEKVEEIEETAVVREQIHFYSEGEWDRLTNSDTNFQDVPDGIIYIYEGNGGGASGGGSEYDSANSEVVLHGGVELDPETGILTLPDSYSIIDGCLVDSGSTSDGSTPSEFNPLVPVSLMEDGMESE